MKLSCGRRRSRLAVRTMRQMNRYRRTRNAILRTSRTSSTAAESKSIGYSDSRANVTSVEPSVTVSPLRSFARLTRFPLTSMPFVEPRSTIQ